MKNNEEVSLIRKADLENHNKDGGFWTVIEGKVYDIKDFQAQSLTGNTILGMKKIAIMNFRKKFLYCINAERNAYKSYKQNILIACPSEGLSHEFTLFFSCVAQFAGEDPVVALEAALQFEDTRESMQAFCVGQYMEVKCVFRSFFYYCFMDSTVKFVTQTRFLRPAQPGDGDDPGPEQSVLSSDRHGEEPRLAVGTSCFFPGPEHTSVTHGDRMCQ